jgi:hypothetical protein
MILLQQIYHLMASTVYQKCQVYNLENLVHQNAKMFFQNLIHLALEIINYLANLAIIVLKTLLESLQLNKMLEK